MARLVTLDKLLSKASVLMTCRPKLRSPDPGRALANKRATVVGLCFICIDNLFLSLYSKQINICMLRKAKEKLCCKKYKEPNPPGLSQSPNMWGNDPHSPEQKYWLECILQTNCYENTHKFYIFLFLKIFKMTL